MDLFPAFSERLGGTGFDLSQSAYAFPTVLWKEAGSDDSQPGTALSSYVLTPDGIPKERGAFTKDQNLDAPALGQGSRYKLSSVMLN